MALNRLSTIPHKIIVQRFFDRVIAGLTPRLEMYHFRRRSEVVDTGKGTTISITPIEQGH